MTTITIQCPECGASEAEVLPDLDDGVDVAVCLGPDCTAEWELVR